LIFVVFLFAEIHKDTYKPSAKANFICDFAEAEYLRRSQRYTKAERKSKFYLQFCRGDPKEVKKDRFSLLFRNNSSRETAIETRRATRMPHPERRASAVIPQTIQKRPPATRGAAVDMLTR